MLTLKEEKLICNGETFDVLERDKYCMIVKIKDRLAKVYPSGESFYICKKYYLDADYLVLKESDEQLKSFSQVSHENTGYVFAKQTS